MNAALRLMTPGTFLDWCQYQEDRRERVDLPTLRHFVIIETDRPQVLLWSRADETDPWLDRDIEGPDAVVPLAAIEVTLPMTAIHDGITSEAKA